MTGSRVTPDPAPPSATPAPRARCWRAKAALLAQLTLALVALVTGVALYLGNRQSASPSLAERQASLDQAVQWLNTQDTRIRREANLPIWWMLHEAATLSGRADLQAVVARADQRMAHSLTPGDPWARFLDPRLPAVPDAIPERNPGAELEPYQQAFLSALTCGGMDARLGGQGNWRQASQCQPNLVHAFTQDKVCSTHQLMGLVLWRRQQCDAQALSPTLANSLRSDIRSQLRWDPVVKDAYLQRVLSLMWTQGEGAIEPIWLRRVMAAQQPDGGWMGRVQFPELPAGLQPWGIRQVLARLLPSAFDPQAQSTDLHATGQGVLLMALAVWSAQHPGQPLPTSSPMP